MSAGMNEWSECDAQHFMRYAISVNLLKLGATWLGSFQAGAGSTGTRSTLADSFRQTCILCHCWKRLLIVVLWHCEH